MRFPWQSSDVTEPAPDTPAVAPDPTSVLVETYRAARAQRDQLQARLSALREEAKRAAAVGDAPALLRLAGQIEPLEAEIARLPELASLEQTLRNELATRAIQADRDWERARRRLVADRAALLATAIEHIRQAQLAMDQLASFDRDHTLPARTAALTQWQETVDAFAPISLNDPPAFNATLPPLELMPVLEALTVFLPDRLRDWVFRTIGPIAPPAGNTSSAQAYREIITRANDLLFKA